MRDYKYRYITTNRKATEGLVVVDGDNIDEELIIISSDCEGEFKYLVIDKDGNLKYLKEIRIRLDIEDVNKVSEILLSLLKKGDIIIDKEYEVYDYDEYEGEEYNPTIYIYEFEMIHNENIYLHNLLYTSYDEYCSNSNENIEHMTSLVTHWDLGSIGNMKFATKEEIKRFNIK